jgi:hypothetical protein
MSHSRTAITINRMGTQGTAKKISTACAALALILFGAPAFAQTTGTLIPNVPGQWFTSDGNPCASCKLYAYEAGSTTPLDTYSDVALTTPNANPVVLDSAGRATIYLSATNYKFVLKTSADVTIWTRDNVGANLSATVAATDNSVCDGRLTLTTSTPVTTADVTAATTVYFTPYKGNRCALYDGSSSWSITSYTELSIALGSDAADTNYDVFIYTSSGNPAIERVAWTSATVRATALTTVDGVLVKSSDSTKRYVGTYRTTSTIGQTEDSATKRFVWNYYNRVKRALRVTETADSWTYTLAAFRQVNANTANQVAVVVGVAEPLLTLRAFHVCQSSGGNTVISTSIGEDSTTTAASGVIMNFIGPVASMNANLTATLDRYPAIGYHYYAWLEYSTASGTTTWYGDAGSPTVIQNGLTGHIEG